MITATDELKKLLASIKGWIVRSIWCLVAFAVGSLLGIVYAEGRILDDCRFSGSFRVGTQAYNCQRKS